MVAPFRSDNLSSLRVVGLDRISATLLSGPGRWGRGQRAFCPDVFVLASAMRHRGRVLITVVARRTMCSNRQPRSHPGGKGSGTYRVYPHEFC